VTGDGVDAAALLRSGPILRLFREYRVEGTRPIFLEGSYGDRLLNIIEKTLYADVPFFLPQVTEGNLRLMNAIIGGLARSPVPRLAVRSLCADWGIGAEKLYQIMFVMESVGLLRIIRVENDTKARSVGAKLFFADATIYPALQATRARRVRRWLRPCSWIPAGSSPHPATRGTTISTMERFAMRSAGRARPARARTSSSGTTRTFPRAARSRSGCLACCTEWLAAVLWGVNPGFR
jgi:hypothetical protein